MKAQLLLSLGPPISILILLKSFNFPGIPSIEAFFSQKFYKFHDNGILGYVLFIHIIISNIFQEKELAGHIIKIILKYFKSIHFMPIYFSQSKVYLKCPMSIISSLIKNTVMLVTVLFREIL